MDKIENVENVENVENKEENIKNLIKNNEDDGDNGDNGDIEDNVIDDIIDDDDSVESETSNGLEDMLDMSEEIKLNTKITPNTTDLCKTVANNRLPILSTLLGIASHNYLNKYMKTGIDGVEYYGEAHLTRWNAWMHTIGMPFTIYGMVLWIPALLRLNPTMAHRLMFSLYYIYGGHYLRINLFIATVYYFFYYFPTLLGSRDYSLTYSGAIDAIKKKSDDIETTTLVKRKNTTLNSLLIRGLGISTAALLFQEIAGHWWGGDMLSRWEAIPNAIVYAKYFSLHHLFY